jgi:hypothetical protein
MAGQELLLQNYSVGRHSARHTAEFRAAGLLRADLVRFADRELHGPAEQLDCRPDRKFDFDRSADRPNSGRNASREVTPADRLERAGCRPGHIAGRSVLDYYSADLQPPADRRIDRPAGSAPTAPSPKSLLKL